MQGGYENLLSEGGPGFIVHLCEGSLGSCSVSGRHVHHRSELHWEHGSTWGTRIQEERETGFACGSEDAPSASEGGGAWKRQTATPCLLPRRMRPRHAPRPSASTRPPPPQTHRAPGTPALRREAALCGPGCLELTSGGDMPAGCSGTQSPSYTLSCPPSAGRTPLRLLFPFRPWLELLN